VSFTEKYVSTLGLFHMVSWGCCDSALLLCKTCLHAAIGLYGDEQGFSNYGLRPQMGPWNVISGSQNQLARQIRYNNFCKIYNKIESRPAVNLFLLHFYFWGNIILYAVSSLLWFLPELSNDNKKQAQQVMRCYTMIVLTY